MIGSTLLTFDPKLYINGDNVDYIRLAEATLRGDVWVSAKYPPLFPWVLSVVQMPFGSSLLPQKILVTLFYVASGILLLRYARTIFPRSWGEPVAWIAITMVPVLEFGHYVMSEIPYLFFSLLALEGVRKLDGGKAVDILFVAFAAMATFYTRSVGASLVLAIFLSRLLSGGRPIRKTLYLAVACGVLSLPWILHSTLGGTNPYFRQLVQVNPYHPEFGLLDLQGWLGRIWTNIEIYVFGEIPANLLPTVFRWTYSPPELRYEFLPWLIALVPLALFTIGLVRSIREKEVVGFYVVIYLLINLVWPRLWTGLRFLVPLIPFMVLLLFRGVFWLFGIVGRSFPRRPKLALILVCLWSLLAIRNQATLVHKVRSYPPAWDAYFRAAAWIRDWAPTDAVIVDRKAAMLAYATGRNVIGFPREADTAKMISWMEENDVDLVVVPPLPYDDIQRYLIPTIRDHDLRFAPAFEIEEPYTVVLRFRPWPEE